LRFTLSPRAYALGCRPGLPSSAALRLVSMRLVPPFFP